MSFYEEFKPIRNKIRKYDPFSIIQKTIQILHQLFYSKIASTSKNPWKYFNPWDLLLAIKWVLASYEKSQKSNKNIKENELRIILKKIDILINKHDEKIIKIDSKYPSNEPLIKTCRRMAFQQFWQQPACGRIKGDSFDRSYFLFSIDDYNKSKKLNAMYLEFQRKMGFSISTFYTISFIIYAIFQNSTNRISFTIKDLIPEGCKLKEEEVGNYLKELSFTLEEGGREIKERIKKSEEEYLIFQSYEQTPFTIKPFLARENQYYVLYPLLIDYTLNYYLYDRLKIDCGSKFSSYFGNKFEEYIRKGLQYTEVAFQDENTIKRKLQKNSKTVDFYFEIEEHAFLIEAKSTEMHFKTKISQDTKKIHESLKSSVIKGVKQAYSVANNLGLNKIIHVLIVTYKEHYLAQSECIWKEFLKDNMVKFCQENNIDINIIQYQNIHIVSVDNWDYMVRILKESPLNLIKAFDDYKSHSDDITKYDFIIDKSLNKFLPEKIEPLPFLKESRNHFLANLEKILDDFPKNLPKTK